MAITLVGNLLSAVALSSPMLIVGRFISGLPHGAFFGTATLIAKDLGRQGQGGAGRLDDGDRSDRGEYASVCRRAR